MLDAIGPAQLRSAFGGAMSADSNPDLESEVREIEKRLREARDLAIRELSERLLDPGLSEVQRVKLEKHLKQFKERG